jgi:uncharacterized membrane protein
MLTVRDQIDIAVPAPRVFAFMDEPSHQAEITPSLTRSERVERLSNGGSLARYTYSIWGLPLKGEVRATDYVPDERIVWALTGRLRGTIRWYFQPTETGTRFTYAATYAIPGPRLARPLLKPLVRRYNEREVQTLLNRLRRRLEGR